MTTDTPPCTAATAGSTDDRPAHGQPSSVLQQHEQPWQGPLQPQQQPRAKASARRPSFTNNFLERLGLRRNSNCSRRMSIESNTTDLGRMEDVAEADAAAGKQTAQCASPSDEIEAGLQEVQEEELCASLSQASLASRCSAYNASRAAGHSVSSGWSMASSSMTGSSCDPPRQRRDSASTRRSSNSSSCAGRGDGSARSVSRNSGAAIGADWASVTGYEAPRSARVAVPEEQLQAAAEAAPQAAAATTSYMPYASCLNVHTLAIKVEQPPEVPFEEAAAAADAAVMRALARFPQLALQRIAVVEGCVLVLLDLAAMAPQEAVQAAGQGMSLAPEDQQQQQQQQQQWAAAPVAGPPQLQQPQVSAGPLQEVGPAPGDSEQLQATCASQQPERCGAAAAAAGAAAVEACAATAATAAAAAGVPAQVHQGPAAPLLRQTLPAKRGSVWALALPAAGDQVVAPGPASLVSVSSSSASSSASSASSQDVYLAQAVHRCLNADASNACSSKSSAAAARHQIKRRRCNPTLAGPPVVIQACGCGVASCGQEGMLFDLVVGNGSTMTTAKTSTSTTATSSSSRTAMMRVVLSGPKGAVYDHEEQLTFQRQHVPPVGTPAGSCCWVARLHLPAAALGTCPGHKLAGGGQRARAGEDGAARFASVPGKAAAGEVGVAPGGTVSHTCHGHTVSVQLLPCGTWVGPGGQQPWLVPGRATVLLLPEGAAAELQGWVDAQQVSVAALQDLVQDVSALLDARQLLAASSRVGRPHTAAAASVVRRMLGVAQLGAVAGERLEPFLRQAGLVRLQQLVAAAKVQLLLCMALLPREAGLDRTHLPAQQQQQQLQQQLQVTVPQPDIHSLATCSRAGAVAAQAPAAQVAAAPSRATAWLMACMGSVQRCAGAAVRSVTQRLGLEGPTPPASIGCSPPTQLAPALSCTPPSPNSCRPTCGESVAAAEGGWAGMALCWQGFSGPGVEEAYLVFKAGHLRLVDWVGRVYLLVFIPSMMLRYMLCHGWWPLHAVYGWHWVLDHTIQAAVMAACPRWWQRRREAWLLAYDARLPLYLTWEVAQWSRAELARAHAGTNKLVLFGMATSLLGLQRPKAALARWAIMGPLLTWQAAARARPGADGVEGWAYAAAQAGGWRAALLSLGYLAANLVLQMALSFVSDLYTRMVFVRRACTLKGTDGCTASGISRGASSSSKGAASSSGAAASACASITAGDSSSHNSRQQQGHAASLRQRLGVTSPAQQVA